MEVRFQRYCKPKERNVSVEQPDYLGPGRAKDLNDMRDHLNYRHALLFYRGKKP